MYRHLNEKETTLGCKILTSEWRDFNAVLILINVYIITIEQSGLYSEDPESIEIYKESVAAARVYFRCSLTLGHYQSYLRLKIDHDVLLQLLGHTSLESRDLELSLGGREGGGQGDEAEDDQDHVVISGHLSLN